MVPDRAREMAGDERHRIGLAFAGKAGDLRSWSGIPAGLSRALCVLGCEVTHVNPNPPGALGSLLVNGMAAALAPRFGLSRPRGALRRARWQARADPAVAGVRRAWAGQRLRRMGVLEAVVQVHGEYQLATAGPVATYDDLTVAQALQLGYAEFEHMSPSKAQRRVELQRQAYVHAAACCTTSAWTAQSIVDDYDIPRHKVFVVGIGSGRLAGPSTERNWTVPRFLFVGKDWERKNGAAVVRAFARVRSAFPGAELHLVGGAPPVAQDGVTVHGMLRLAEPNERAAVDDLYRRATCFVMPSHVEPSAVAYVEAAMSGLPIIGTTVGGSSDIIGDGGVLVDPGDHDALAAAMVQLCDGQRASLLGGVAAARAGRFSWTAVASRILAALSLPGFAGLPASLDTWVSGDVS